MPAPEQNVTIKAAVFQQANMDQLESLCANLQKDKWNHQEAIDVTWDFNFHAIVIKFTGKTNNFFLVIEQDGYAHS